MGLTTRAAAETADVVMRLQKTRNNEYLKNSLFDPYGTLMIFSCLQIFFLKNQISNPKPFLDIKTKEKKTCKRPQMTRVVMIPATARTPFHSLFSLTPPDNNESAIPAFKETIIDFLLKQKLKGSGDLGSKREEQRTRVRLQGLERDHCLRTTYQQLQWSQLTPATFSLFLSPLFCPSRRLSSVFGA